MPATIILVHGAFAESASWNRVIPALRSAGHRVIAYAAPLRSIPTDAAGLSALVQTLDGPGTTSSSPRICPTTRPPEWRLPSGRSPKWA